VLTLAQSESAGQAAFMIAAVLGLGAILGTLFVSRTQVPSEPTAPATDLI
jgi:DHA2 family lincomycin resistance protein-like MFS transporter